MCLGHRWRAPIPNLNIGETPRIGGGPEAGAATEDPTGLGAAGFVAANWSCPPVSPRLLSRLGVGAAVSRGGLKLRATGNATADTKIMRRPWEGLLLGGAPRVSRSVAA